MIGNQPFDDDDRALAFRPFPIDNFRTRSELRKRLMDRFQSTSGHLLAGSATSFDDYRYRVGILKGIEAALAELDDIEKQEN